MAAISRNVSEAVKKTVELIASNRPKQKKCNDSEFQISSEMHF